MPHNQEKVTIYTDGACSGNPGPGGWGVLMHYKDKEKELYGYEADTTNNRMELKAAIEALRAMKRTIKIDLYTDSTYVRNGISEWLKGWKAKGWKGANRKPIKNIDLWQELDLEVQKHDVTFHWVKGHAGHPGNERADELARRGIEENTL
jgi:ribonuclease HI